MSDTLAMGGYGAYVWSSVGLTVIVLVLCAVQARRRYRNVLQQIRAQNGATETKE
ncbi:MAG TPA: heme exporter protein CcmD [Woeseiaceae bacterium]|nr:heme exporter protein CcmD [Woeseiaceae bacterium]